jgi:hypothetical protein
MWRVAGHLSLTENHGAGGSISPLGNNDFKYVAENKYSPVSQRACRMLHVSHGADQAAMVRCHPPTSKFIRCLQIVDRIPWRETNGAQGRSTNYPMIKYPERLDDHSSPSGNRGMKRIFVSHAQGAYRARIPGRKHQNIK